MAISSELDDRHGDQGDEDDGADFPHVVAFQLDRAGEQAGGVLPPDQAQFQERQLGGQQKQGERGQAAEQRAVQAVPAAAAQGCVATPAVRGLAQLQHGYPLEEPAILAFAHDGVRHHATVLRVLQLSASWPLLGRRTVHSYSQLHGRPQPAWRGAAGPGITRLVFGVSTVSTVSLDQRPHLIVLGNEKGGSGKSTTAMHLVVGLLREGYRVGAVDLDARQGTLSGYFAARTAYAARHGVELPMPQAESVFRSEIDSRAEAEAEERAALEAALDRLSAGCEIVVIDCPGADTNLARLAHARADTLITPINDSFVDFAMLARVDPDNHAVINPSIYSEMVWQARKTRFSRDRTRIDWIVMRNRMGSTEMRNKRDVGTTLETLAKRIGFRTVKGFGERVIFRELYLQGLTLMDVREAGLQISLGMSHVAARAEVRALLSALKKPPPRGAAAMADVRASMAAGCPATALPV